MFRPVSWASASRTCRVGLGVFVKAAFNVSNCLALIVVRGPRRLPGFDDGEPLNMSLPFSSLRSSEFADIGELLSTRFGGNCVCEQLIDNCDRLFGPPGSDWDRPVAPFASIGVGGWLGNIRPDGANAGAITLPASWPLVSIGVPFVGCGPFRLLRFRWIGGHRLDEPLSELFALLLFMLSWDSELIGFELFIELDNVWPFGRPVGCPPGWWMSWWGELWWGCGRWEGVSWWLDDKWLWCEWRAEQLLDNRWSSSLCSIMWSLSHGLNRFSSISASDGEPTAFCKWWKKKKNKKLVVFFKDAFSNVKFKWKTKLIKQWLNYLKKNCNLPINDRAYIGECIHWTNITGS